MNGDGWQVIKNRLNVTETKSPLQSVTVTGGTSPVDRTHSAMLRSQFMFRVDLYGIVSLGFLSFQLGCSPADGAPDHQVEEDVDPIECPNVPNTMDWWASEESEALRLINELRASGLRCGNEDMPPVGAVVSHPILRCTARAHSMDMRERDYFAHVNPDGEDPWKRNADAGYTGIGLAENIASGSTDAQQTIDLWISSPDHCKNMMHPDAIELGLGFVIGGSKRAYWTMIAGRPS